MKLVYFDDSAEFKEFISDVCVLIEKNINENVEYFFETRNGTNDDFIYFQNGIEVSNIENLPVIEGIMPKMLLKKSVVSQFLENKDVLYLIDVNFAPEVIGSYSQLNTYGIELAKYLYSKGIEREQIHLFTFFPGIVSDNEKSMSFIPWFYYHDKKELTKVNAKNILASILSFHFNKIKINLGNGSTIQEILLDNKLKQLNVIAQSENFIKTIQIARKAALTDSNVLILGETGVGKEKIANVIHSSSNRSEEKLVTVNCGAIPLDLIETELFGSIKGAYTGAINKEGFFSYANGGTIFLDEIGDLPKNAQVKLNRIIEYGTYIKVGDNKEQTVDVRIIAATNKNLIQMISEGIFREDLYYRLNVLEINIPALRDRREDIIPLLKYFLLGNKHNKRDLVISDEATKYLLNHHWNGNIRELKNLSERIVVNCTGSIITKSLVETNLDKTSKPSSTHSDQSVKKNLDLLLQSIVPPGKKNFFTHFKKAIEKSRHDLIVKDIVWEILYGVLYSAIYNKYEYSIKEDKSHQPRQVLLAFIKTLNIGSLSNDKQIINYFSELNPHINLDEIDFDGLTKEKGSAEINSPKWTPHREILREIILSKISK